MTDNKTPEQTTIDVQPADQPLDVSPYLVEADSPELAEYKQKVLEVAREHSRRHHCGSVDEVLRPLGLRKENFKIKVKVETPLGFEFEVKIEPTKLTDKTLEEQKVTICDAIGSFSIGQGTGSFKLKPEMISRLEVVTPFRSGSADVHDGGVADDLPGAWLYISSEGRVRHYFRTLRVEEETPMVIRDTRGESVMAHYRNHHAACGVSTNHPQVTSPRGHGNRCTGCQQSIGANNG